MLFRPGSHISAADRSNAQKIVKYYLSMKYDGCCVSTSDLKAGVKFLKGLEGTNELFLSVNLLRDRRPVFPPFKILNVRGLKVALIGVTDMDFSFNTKDGVTIAEPINALKHIWPKIKEAQVIIVLSSLNYQRSQAVATIFPEISLMVSSGLGLTTYVPRRIGEGCLLVSSHPKGKSVGIIKLILGKDYRVKDYDNKLIMLREEPLTPQL